MEKQEKPYSEFGYKLFYFFKPFFKLPLRLKVKGLENIPLNKGCIIAANHRSYLDPPVLNLASPRPIIFLAKYDLFKIPILNWIITKAGAMPLYGGRKDLKTLKKAIEYLKEGYCIGIFPEGTRMKPNTFGKAHNGVGLLALKSKVPVIPTYIHNTDKVLPVGSGFPKLFLHSVNVEFGKPLDFSNWEDKKENYQKIADIILYEIKNLSKGYKNDR